MGSRAGLAPSSARIRAVRRHRTVALLVWGVPLALVLAGVYWRLAVSAAPLALGLFTWILPAAVAAVVAAILWVLIVERNARGDTLGDELRAATDIDARVVAEDEDLVEAGRELVEAGQLAADRVDAHVLEAKERITDALEVSHRSLQIASSVLGVPNVPTVRPENLVAPTTPHAERIVARAREEVATLAELAAQLGVDHLPPLEALPSPYIALSEPPDLRPGTEHVDGRALPSYPASTLTAVPLDAAQEPERPSGERRRWRPVALILAIFVVAGLVAWLLLNGPSALGSGPGDPVGSAGLSEPDSPADVREGRDYGLLDEGPDGTPVRWSCARPIPVRLAGAAPPGATEVVSEAITSVAAVSGLPLVLGAPLAAPVTDGSTARPGEIVVSYLTPEQVQAAGIDLADTVMGRGGSRFDARTGRVESGWVVIRAEADPTTDIGRWVAWHELAHAVNVGHAAPEVEGKEVMAPTTTGGAPPSWGPGDRYALQSVGCPGD